MNGDKMSTPENGGPAFPTEGQTFWHHGMSLRDYFAAQALQGLLASGYPRSEAALGAYKMADYMLYARNVGKESDE